MIIFVYLIGKIIGGNKDEGENNKYPKRIHFWGRSNAVKWLIIL
jgi:ascorbate-specific PTS system EIIC-type component UlaA